MFFTITGIIILQLSVIGFAACIYWRMQSSKRSRNSDAKKLAETSNQLSSAQDALSTHGQQLIKFSDVAESAGIGDDRSVAAASDELKRANVALLEAISEELINAIGNQLGSNTPDLLPYRNRTIAIDDELGKADTSNVSAVVTGTIIKEVSNLRRENDELRAEVERTKNQLVEQIRRAESAEQVARVDTLTQLPNRRAFEEAHARCHSDLDRYGIPYCIVVIDLDHFKQVNDEFGHAAGDAALSLVGRVLRDAQRATDYACRLGGEEFSLLLRKCELQDAMRVAERFREKIGSAKLRFNGTSIMVTASIGVSQASSDESSRRVLERADQALYTAKAAGRDNVQCWSEPASPESECSAAACPAI